MLASLTAPVLMFAADGDWHDLRSFLASRPRGVGSKALGVASWAAAAQLGLISCYSEGNFVISEKGRAALVGL